MSDDKFDLLQVLNAATHIVASRILSMVCLLMVFGLFCWSMYMQTTLACAVAGGFALFVFLPVLWGDRRKGD